MRSAVILRACAARGRRGARKGSFMKNWKKRGAVLAFLTAGMMRSFCFSAFAAGNTAGMDVSYASRTGYAAAAETEALTEMLKTAKEQEALITGEDPLLIPDSRFMVGNRTENDIRVTSIAGQCMAEDGEDRVFYVIGEAYTPEGSALPAMFGGTVEYSCTLERTLECQDRTYKLVRFAVQKRSGEDAGRPESGSGGHSLAEGGIFADEQIPEQYHWKLGDVVKRTLDGVSYRFCCIDPNYEEGEAMGQSLALFLCESVIPADTGSQYVYEQREDGSFGYVFYPGPVIRFGENAEYADSDIRAWLTGLESEADVMPRVNAGVETSCMGQTAAGTFSRLRQSDLRFSRMGDQFLMDRYFLLSVEEALRYREYLWKVDGCGEEETSRNAGTFSGGYWLRTPMGDGDGAETRRVYVVDLVNGNLHPQEVMPETEGEADAELAVTSPIGVRPAFVLKQIN